MTSLTITAESPDVKLGFSRPLDTAMPKPTAGTWNNVNYVWKQVPIEKQSKTITERTFVIQLLTYNAFRLQAEEKEELNAATWNNIIR